MRNSVLKKSECGVEPQGKAEIIIQKQLSSHSPREPAKITWMS